MSLKKNSFIVSFFTGLSRIFGFIRDLFIARFLGAGMLSDVFFMAFRLPNLFRKLFAEGALNPAFVPIFSRELSSNKENAKLFARRVFSILFYILLIFTILFEIFMPFFVEFFAEGFSDNPEKLSLTITLSRITFPYLLFISLVSLMSGILNSLGKFSAPAASPIFLNLTLITSIFVLGPISATLSHALSIGAAIAGVIQFILLYIPLKKENFNPKLVKPQLSPKIKRLLKRMIPGIIGAGIYNINIAVDTYFAAYEKSSVSWLYYADRLTQLPLAMIGIAISIALLPALSKLIKNKKTTEAEKTQNNAIELALFLTMPATIFLYIGAFVFISLLFQHGEFNLTDAIATSNALKIYVISLPASIISKILITNFFARGDTKTPMQIALFAMIFNVVFDYILFKYFGFMGIVFATTCASWIRFFLLFAVLFTKKKFKIYKKTIINSAKIILISLFSGFIAKTILNGVLLKWEALTLFYKILYLILVFGTALASYFIVSFFAFYKKLKKSPE